MTANTLRGKETEIRHPTDQAPQARPSDLQPASTLGASNPIPHGESSTDGKIAILPNWASSVDLYLVAARLYGKDPFTTRALASAKIGTTSVSTAALDAESTSLYNLLRMTSMYGLVEWYGGEDFAIRVLPESSFDEWKNAFDARAGLLRDKVVTVAAERNKLRQLGEKKIETVYYKDRAYVVAYVGFNTRGESINAFVYNAWDPNKHAGIVLKARGKNIPIARAVCETLCLS